MLLIWLVHSCLVSQLTSQSHRKGHPLTLSKLPPQKKAQVVVSSRVGFIPWFAEPADHPWNHTKALDGKWPFSYWLLGNIFPPHEPPLHLQNPAATEKRQRNVHLWFPSGRIAPFPPWSMHSNPTALGARPGRAVGCFGPLVPSSSLGCLGCGLQEQGHLARGSCGSKNCSVKTKSFPENVFQE